MTGALIDRIFGWCARGAAVLTLLLSGWLLPLGAGAGLLFAILTGLHGLSRLGNIAGLGGRLGWLAAMSGKALGWMRLR